MPSQEVARLHYLSKSCYDHASLLVGHPVNSSRNLLTYSLNVSLSVARKLSVYLDDVENVRSLAMNQH